MNRARLDFGGFDAHADKDAMDGFDGCLGLFFPPGHSLLDVLVQSFHLGGSKLKTFEPFLVVRIRQRFWRVVREEVTGCARIHKEAGWIKTWWRRCTSMKGFLNWFCARCRRGWLVVLVHRVGSPFHLGDLCFKFQNALLA